MTAAASADTQGVCGNCGGLTGRWGAVRVGDQPVRLNSAVIVARICTSCGSIELRGREARAGAVPATRQAHGRDLLQGVLRNIAEAVRTLARAVRDRRRGPKK